MRTSKHRRRPIPFLILLAVTALPGCSRSPAEPSCSVIAADTLPNGILVTAEMCPHLVVVQ